MSNIKNKLKRVNKRVYIIGTALLMVLVILIGVLCSWYYMRLQESIREESGSYLLELSKKTADHIEKMTADNFSILSTIEMVLQNTTPDETQDLPEIISALREKWGFNEILLIDKNGTAYDSTARKVSLGAGDYLSETVSKRNASIAPAQVINGEESILFTIPVEDVAVDQTDIKALGITYRLNSFDDILSISAFDGRAYTIVTNLDGTMAVPSSSQSAAKFGFNALASLHSMTPDNKKSVDEMGDNMLVGKSGQIECKINNESNYIVYYPLKDNEWCILTIVPVAVANAKTGQLISLTLMFCIFITLLVSVLVLLLALNFFSSKKELEKIAFVDSVTGGNTLQKFVITATEFLKSNSETSYAMIYTNLEKFRLTNEQHGRDTGDQLLKAISKVIRTGFGPHEIGCRIADDHFCLLVEYANEETMQSRLVGWCNEIDADIKKSNLDIEMLTSHFGVYIINDKAQSLTSMVDRARFASTKLDFQILGKIRYAVYDEFAHQRVIREKQLEDRMEKALEEGEFMAYLQPKYEVQSEKIGGAEALVRWNSKTDGMIYPDEFIPLFEKNGFIVKLDHWMFEQVCIKIKEWLNQGKQPVKISINCSRAHFSRHDFIGAYREILNRYDIPTEYLELELTESIVYENVERLNEIINQIHSLGIQCSIDDFGSGYSSLSMIQNIAADTLKLDKIFFKPTSHDDGRGRSVVDSIVRMAKALSMTTVAEGVEYRPQVDFLKTVDCDYVQGYVFARPMPIADFEKLLFGE